MPIFSRAKTLADQIADLEDPTPRDVDPEDDRIYESDSGTSEAPSAVGREHYVGVEKSKLRSRDAVPLGPQYRGSRIDRNQALGDTSDEDPFSKFDHDERESASPSFPSQDEDRPGREIRTSNGAPSSPAKASNEHDEDAVASDMDRETDQWSSEEGIEGEDEGYKSEESEDQDEELDNNVDRVARDATVDREELRKLMGEEQKNVTAAITAATKADAEKGKAVKQQRATFDALLNTRVRLQKALICTNSFSAIDDTPDAAELNGALKAAESAALRLWSSLNKFRQSNIAARAGSKRKRAEISLATSNKEIWEVMQAHEAENVANRRTILGKWSVKARSATTLVASRRLNDTLQQTIVDVLADQLSNPERLIKRTRLPRSCAPMQLSKGITESAEIYDDADFYGLLLKELLEQRSVDSAANVQVDGAVTHWKAAREAKTKKNVDTKASKGRKLRYAVHEKLQNFMAPEDRRRWEEARIDDLFGSLFGRRVRLDETLRDERDGEDELGDQAMLLFGGRR